MRSSLLVVVIGCLLQGKIVPNIFVISIFFMTIS